MKNKLRTTKIALVISSISLFISAINLLFCVLNKQNIAGAVSTFCCMIAVLCSNIAIYSSAKKDNNDQQKP